MWINDGPIRSLHPSLQKYSLRPTHVSLSLNYSKILNYYVVQTSTTKILTRVTTEQSGKSHDTLPLFQQTPVRIINGRAQLEVTTIGYNFDFGIPEGLICLAPGETVDAPQRPSVLVSGKYTLLQVASR